MLKEFKKFILRGNVIELFTGIIIGASFTGIVTAFSKGIIEPLLALAGSGARPKWSVGIGKGVELDLGAVAGALISFLITAAVVFFGIVKPANLLLKREEAAAVPQPVEPSSTDKLLMEIRDALKAGGGAAQPAADPVPAVRRHD